MARLFRLTERSYIGGRIRERGEIVSLLPHERPGAHMRPIPQLPDEAAAPPIPAPAPAPVQPVSAPQPDPVAPLPWVPSEPVPRPVVPGYLVFDTETNGVTDPRLAQIAMLFVDQDLRIEHEYTCLVQPDGWDMPAEVTRVHGLTVEKLRAEGSPVIAPLHVFRLAVDWGRTLVAHNLAFDLRVITGELGRASLPAPPEHGVCTMLKARDVLGKGGLNAAHEALTGAPVLDAHDALADARACLAIFRKLRDRGAA